MEAVMVVLRPKVQGTPSHVFKAKCYDVLLIDSGNVKKLPRFTLSYEQEPTEELLKILYDDLGGLKGKRAVFVPPTRNEPVFDDNGSPITGTLYCIPLDSNDDFHPSVAENTPAFFSLNEVFESLSTGSSTEIPNQTRLMLFRTNSWLKEKYNVPGAIDLLFSSTADYRLQRSISNPAYAAENRSFHHTQSRTLANEALARMLAIEKCDSVIMNPLFKSGLPYKSKVDSFAVNKFWRKGKPDYSKIILSLSQRILPTTNEPKWIEEFPLHKAAFEGNGKAIKELIKRGYAVSKKDRESWTPIHYAAWKGNFEAVTLLLTEGDCSPNITNDQGSTALHFAAVNGHAYVVEILLAHSETDANALDKNDKSALNLCENIDKPDWHAVAKLLKRAMNTPSPKIQVFLMDGTFRMLNLLSGANTTVQQLHQQLVTELKINAEHSHLFTLWICSKHLQLQLKPHHKPIQHLNDWRRKIVGMLTDQDPAREDPQLFWRRDAMLILSEEKKHMNDAVVVSLLFHEAYHNYIQSLYACADDDVIMFGGILLQLNHGDYEPRKAKNYFVNERALKTLVPEAKLKNRSSNWANKIQTQWHDYSKAFQNRSPMIMQSHFLSYCWNLTVYGSAFFTGYVQIRTTKSPTLAFISVNDIGVHIINATNKMMLQSFSYREIEWLTKSDRPILEIRLKGSSKGGLCIMTKQSGLINNLMNKMQTLNEQFVEEPTSSTS